MAFLTIAIPTYNRVQWLKITLATLIEQVGSCGRSDIDILVSDNCSTDGTYEFLKEISLEYRIIINRNDSNIGGERNFRLLPTLAKGEYVFMVGDDDVLIPGALARILSVLNNRPDYVILNTKTYTPDFNACLSSNVLAINEDKIINSPNECLNIVSAMLMGFISLWVARKEFFNVISDEEYFHFSKWGMSIQADRYIGISKYPNGYVISEPCLKTRQDGSFSHNYYEWFLVGGLETMKYAVNTGAMDILLLKPRKSILLRKHGLGRIRYERRAGCFSFIQAYSTLRKCYGNLWSFWLLAIPTMLLPGVVTLVDIMKFVSKICIRFDMEVKAKIKPQK